MARAPLGFFDPVPSLHREMNRLFEEAARGPAAGPAGSASPRMDVAETPQEIRIEMELPGAAAPDVQVELAGDVLTIRGEIRRPAEDAHLHVAERVYGRFVRSLRLPFAPRPDQVRAGFAQGVLTIVLPKSAAAAGVHRIPVRATDAEPAGHPADEGTAVAGHPTPETTRGRTGPGEETGR